MSATRSQIRVCLAVSAGGHATQLLKLQHAWVGYDCFSITTSAAVEKQLARFGPVHIVAEANRRRPLTAVKVLIHCTRIVLAGKPDVVISTGAAVGCIAGMVAKLMGARVIWVDSIANVDRLSLSARLIRPFADLLITQWPDVALRYKSVEYVGHIV